MWTTLRKGYADITDKKILMVLAKHCYLITWMIAMLYIFTGCQVDEPSLLSKNKIQKESTLSKEIALHEIGESIKSADLKKHLQIIASDAYEGRLPGHLGDKKAAEYLKGFYIERHIFSPISKVNYYQLVPEDYIKKHGYVGYILLNIKGSRSHNIIAYIKGSEIPEEVVIISAHMDHIRVKQKGAKRFNPYHFGSAGIYNGADDNGSGMVAILEIAEAFQEAKKLGKIPRRSVAFIHFTAEELGLVGSQYYVENDPVFPIRNTVVNLNADMVGRVDEKHSGDPNYVYIIGSDLLSTQLKKINESANKKYTRMVLDYSLDNTYRIQRSDHYNFLLKNVPVIFYHSGLHADYHMTTDDEEKINYDMLEKRARLIFYVAWEIANMEQRLLIDRVYTESD